MPIQVTFTVTKGGLKSRQYQYSQHTTLIIGRQKDCAIAMPETTVSRYHCLLDIAPPSVILRDFGSLNGTYLNGQKIGQREKGLSPEAGRKAPANEFTLKSGDRVGLGPDCEFSVNIDIPMYCGVCYREITAAENLNPGGSPICPACNAARQKASPAGQPVAPAGTRCLICGGNLTAAQRRAAGVCGECQAQPVKIIDYFLKSGGGPGGGKGSALAGYRKMGLIGKGGMGEVWLLQNEAGDKLAIKLMLPRAAADESSPVQFVREASMMGQLNHKNVVRQYGFGQVAGVYFITMEYCPNGSVNDYMKKNGGKLSLEKATRIILQALDGLIYTHGAPITAVLQGGQQKTVNGVVHRDFKPGNVFLTGDINNPTVKIADFGLAKAFETAGLSGHTYTGAKAGTPVFMPRQQVIDFKYAKPAVDVWAAAATYYNMLTGCFPKDFSGKDMMLDALTKDAVPILKRGVGIPPRLAAVIDQALTEKPNIGFQTAKELKQAIEKAL
jgi:serine/threonine-protein kinase